MIHVLFFCIIKKKNKALGFQNLTTNIIVSETDNISTSECYCYGILVRSMKDYMINMLVSACMPYMHATWMTIKHHDNLTKLVDLLATE